MKKIVLSAATGALFSLATTLMTAHAQEEEAVDLAQGERVYNSTCLACHNTGAADAPKKGDKAAWDQRLEQGFDTLVAHAINGIGAMPAKGGNPNLSDEDIRNSTAYMVVETGIELEVAQAESAPAEEPAEAEEPAREEELAEAETAPAEVTEGSVSAGKEKSGACAACHSADGNSTNPEWPKLAGQHANYLAKQLHGYKSGERVNATMAPMAAPLSAQDIEDLAAFYSAQSISPGEADPDLVELGEQLYRGGNLAAGVSACSACHGPAGAGNPAANFPALASQHATYTELQLREFRSGARANDAGQMMRNIASRMTDAEMRAVSSYIQGLQP